MPENFPLKIEMPSSNSSKGGFQVTVREIIVDIIAGLLPGFVFLVVLIPALLMPLLAVCVQFRESQANLSQILATKSFSSILEPFRLEIFGAALAFSYVIGQLFYRQDPKTPDFRSVQRCGATKDGAVRASASEDTALDAFNGVSGLLLRCFRWKWVKDCFLRWKPGAHFAQTEVEFPYHFLHDYLKQRGLDHLSDMVSWTKDGRRAGSIARTKQFINMIKIRLEFDFPDRYNEIARNEAHVRLMSSVWYCARALFICSAVGAILAELANIPWGVSKAWRHSEFLIISIVVLVSVRLVQDNVERVFHYQRIREIFFVLETAFWAAKTKPEILDRIREEANKAPEPTTTAVTPRAP